MSAAEQLTPSAPPVERLKPFCRISVTSNKVSWHEPAGTEELGGEAKNGALLHYSLSLRMSKLLAPTLQAAWTRSRQSPRSARETLWLTLWRREPTRYELKCFIATNEDEGHIFETVAQHSIHRQSFIGMVFGLEADQVHYDHYFINEHEETDKDHAWVWLLRQLASICQKSRPGKASAHGTALEDSTLELCSDLASVVVKLKDRLNLKLMKNSARDHGTRPGGSSSASVSPSDQLASRLGLNVVQSQRSVVAYRSR